MSTTQTEAGLLRGLLVNVLGNYIVHIDQLEIDVTTPSEGMMILTICVEAGDHAKVLGKQARSLKALETIFSTIGNAVRMKMFVRLRKSKPPMESPVGDRDDSVSYDASKVLKSLKAIMALICGQDVFISHSNGPGITAFVIRPTIPVPQEFMDSMSVLIDLFGAKARRKFYLEFNL